MSAPLDVEIARRLGTDPEATEEALHAVLDRVRQQVGLYGYARLAGIGTFRQHEGGLTFEADPVLAEAVNHRFAGLEPLQVASPSAPPDEPAAEPPVAPAADETEAAEAPFRSPEEPELSVSPPFDEIEEPSDEAFWISPEATEAPHPLGPRPEPYEDADFSVVPGEETTEQPAESGESDDYAPPASDDETAASAEPKIFFDPSYADVPAASGTPDEPELSPAEEPEPGLEPKVRWSDESDDADARAEETPPVASSPAATATDFSPEEPAESFSDTRSEDLAEDAEPSFPAEETPPFAPVEPPAQPPAEQPVEQPQAAARTPRPAQPRHRVQHGPNRVAQEQDRPVAPWIVGAVAVIVVGAVAWLLFRPAPLDPVEQPLVIPPDTEAVAGNLDTADAALPGLEDVEDTTAAPVGPPPDQPEPAEPADEGTPLRSAAGIDVARGGYTIVVTSAPSQAAAERAAARYSEMGYRTGVISSASGGTTRHRVAVGQFSSLEEADASRTELQGGDLPQDAWIMRIQ